MIKPAVIFAVLSILTMHTNFVCHPIIAKNPTIEDLPELIRSVGASDDQPDFEMVDALIEVISEPDGKGTLLQLFADADPDQKNMTARALGWVGYRIIESDPDSRLLDSVLEILAKMVDDESADLQIAAIKAVRVILSSEIEFVNYRTDGTSPVANVSLNNRYFSGCLRMLVGGVNNESNEVSEQAGEIFQQLGYTDVARITGWGRYTFDTSIGTREWTEVVLEQLDLTLDQFIEYTLDLSEAVQFMDAGIPWGFPRVGYSLDRVFTDLHPNEIAVYLGHHAPSIRNLALSAMLDSGDESMSYIREAYRNGSARVQLELIDLVEPGPTDLYKFTLLDQIIHDENLAVSYTDTSIFRTYVESNEITSVEEYPFDVIGFYVRLLESGNSSNISQAAIGIGELGADASETVPHLIEVIRGPDNSPVSPYYANQSLVTSTQHCTVITAIGKIGPAASEAIPILAEIRSEDDGNRRFYAAGALYQIEYNQADQVEFLIDHINTESAANYLTNLLENLTPCGPDASEALPRLYELAEYDDYMIRHKSRLAIFAIVGNYDRVLEMMIVNLENGDDLTREIAAREILWILDDTDLSNAVPSLVDALDDELYSVRQLACMTLVELGGFEELVVPVIADLLDENDDQGGYVVRMLVAIGSPAADDAMPAVLRVFESDNYNNVRSAINVSCDVWGANEVLVDALIEMTYSSNFTNQRIAIEALGDLGSGAAGALPRLREIFTAEGGYMLEFAETAIAKIEGTYVEESE